MVRINSLTGLPFSTLILLNTSSASGCLSTVGGCAASFEHAPATTASARLSRSIGRAISNISLRQSANVRDSKYMTTSREAKIGAGDYTYLGGGCRIVENAQGGNLLRPKADRKIK